MTVKVTRILVIVAAGWLILTALLSIWPSLSNYLILTQIGLLSTRILPFAKSALYLALSGFALVKLFVKNLRIIQATAAVLVVCGAASLVVFSIGIAYYSPFVTLATLASVLPSIATAAFPLVPAVLALLIGANTYKRFIGNTAAHITSGTAALLGFVVYLWTNLPDSLAVFQSWRYTLNMALLFLSQALIFFALFIVCAYGLSLRPLPVDPPEREPS